ncbi:MAG: hypothetical protein SF182_00805 [Deltaproteobacteria bacterium]|nr:hypothetical protein [Deltaproteobacteria bacterium]
MDLPVAQGSSSVPGAAPRSRAGATRLATMLSLVALCTLLPLPAAACPGDCNADAAVTVDEIVRGVRIALGEAPLADCPAADADGDGPVSVSDLIAAVNAALSGCPPPRLVALSRAGRIASLDLLAPWTLRASADLGSDIASARCGAGRCLIVHPSIDAVSVVDALTLARGEPIQLQRAADPRDVALVGARTAVVGQYGRAELLEIDLLTRDTMAIDLTPLADADGVPEVLHLATCGRRVFVQLRRVDHQTEVPSPPGAVIAVIDLDRPNGERLVDVDSATPGIQGIALAERPAFDMPVDCAAGALYVAEPRPLMQGGGGYQVVDLRTLVARELPIATGAEVGGFAAAGPDAFWLITHTEFGPGPSSHLTLTSHPEFATHNTFAFEHVNDLAIDLPTNVLFYPDPCFGPSCGPGIYAFAADDGERLSPAPVDPGFLPIELAVAR